MGYVVAEVVSMPMPMVEQFAYGPINPLMSFVMAYIGAQLGLSCTARAQRSVARGRRARWLLLAAAALGGAGIWLMHFMAMLGFDIPASPVRYDVTLTAVSLVTAVAFVAAGLFIVGFGRASILRTTLGGLLTGVGIAAMHYTGMAAMHINGRLTYDYGLVALSVLIAVVASTVALWFTVAVKGWGPITAASVIFALAVCTMHYTGMAALRVHLEPGYPTVPGVDPLLLVVPIIGVAAAALFGLLFVALGMMGDDEFVLTVDRRALDGDKADAGRAHARPVHPAVHAGAVEIGLFDLDSADIVDADIVDADIIDADIVDATVSVSPAPPRDGSHLPHGAALRSHRA